MAGNLANMPVLLWHGGKDKAVRQFNSEAMRDALKRFGNNPKWYVNQEAGHMVPAGEKIPHNQWLLQQTRKRSDRFQFVVDTPNHTSAWGIRAPRPRLGQPLPRFTCMIKDNLVTIDSQNAVGLDVQLGKGDLGLSGNVTVIWNNHQVYSGRFLKTRSNSAKAPAVEGGKFPAVAHFLADVELKGCGRH